MTKSFPEQNNRDNGSKMKYATQKCLNYVIIIIVSVNILFFTPVHVYLFINYQFESINVMF